MKTTKSEFEAALELAIKRTIRELKADGVTGMGLSNLRMVTPTPATTLKGAPLGTNAAYYYGAMFGAVARTVGGRFVLGGAS